MGWFFVVSRKCLFLFGCRNRVLHFLFCQVCSSWLIAYFPPQGKGGNAVITQDAVALWILEIPCIFCSRCPPAAGLASSSSSFAFYSPVPMPPTWVTLSFMCIKDLGLLSSWDSSQWVVTASLPLHETVVSRQRSDVTYSQGRAPALPCAEHITGEQKTGGNVVNETECFSSSMKTGGWPKTRLCQLFLF